MRYQNGQNGVGAPVKDRAAARLARSHYRVDHGIRKIFRIRAVDANREEDHSEPIKLLEVSIDTFPAGIRPVYLFTNSENAPSFPSVVVSITPQEYRQLLDGNLQLPKEWKIAEPIDRPQRIKIGARHVHA